jgi:hypothetical protein
MTQQSTEPKIGDKAPDGTVFAGVSPDTGKPMYTTPCDEQCLLEHSVAERVAENLRAYGHRDWRLPTKGELNVLFNNRAAIGGFNQSPNTDSVELGVVHDNWYWSGTHIPDDTANLRLRDLTWAQRFDDGKQFPVSRVLEASTRYVRCEAPKVT